MSLPAAATTAGKSASAGCGSPKRVKKASRLEGHTGFIRAIRFFPDDLQVATSGLDGTVRIWESATGKQLARFIVGSMVDGLDVSSDGSTRRQWWGRRRNCAVVAHQQTEVADLSKIGPGGSRAVPCPQRETAWPAATLMASCESGAWPIARWCEKCRRPSSDDRPGVPQTIAALADGHVAVIGYDTGVLMATDIGSRARTWRFESSPGKSPTAIAVSADHKLLLVGYEDGAVRLHSASAARCNWN